MARDGTITKNMRRRNMRLWSVLAMAVGAAIALWWFAGRNDELRVVRGRVTGVDVNGVGIGLNGEGYVIGTGQSWQGLDGAWHEGGQPECLPPMSRGASVELGVVPVPAGHDAPGHPSHVAWVRCITLPTDVYSAGEQPLALDHAYRAAAGVDD